MYILQEFFSKRSHRHEVVVWSSFFYLLSAILIGPDHIMITGFLFLVFLTSIFYHSHPNITPFRIADWLASLSFLLYMVDFVVATKFYNSALLSLFFLLTLLALVSLLISFIAQYLEVKYLYNVSHILWHFTSCVAICFVFFTL